jgi:predicted transcriptional regulator
MAKETVVLGVRLSRAIAQSVKTYADERGMTITAVAERALKAYITSNATNQAIAA